MSALSSGNGAVGYVITSTGLSQPDIRSILAEQTAQGNASGLLGFQKLNSEQRLIVGRHTSQARAELVMVTV